MPMRIAVLLLAALGAACFHRPPPSLHVAKLTVQRSAAGVRPFIHATIDGEPLTMVVDTGAYANILPTDFAKRHHLGQFDSNTDGRLSDANGRMARARQAVGVQVQFEGEAAPGKMNFMVLVGADVTEGILAMQEVVRPGWVLIFDLGHDELRYEQEEPALTRLRAQAPALREVDFRRCLSEGLLAENHRSVPATINGVQTSLLVDTGATMTAMARNSPALQSMLDKKGNRARTIAIMSEGQTLQVPDVPLELSGTSLKVTMLVERHAQTCGEGLLGADVLSACTLVWGWSSMWIACG
jgi:predicted aspartyl protease